MTKTTLFKQGEDRMTQWEIALPTVVKKLKTDIKSVSVSTFYNDIIFSTRTNIKSGINNSRYFFFVFLLLLVSCSPRVIVQVKKVYPPILSIDSVTIYELGEDSPDSAEVIGQVAVVDEGTSTKCKYDQVLRLAQEATAKSGGNGLAITEHEEPSVWGSACHQITGTMLRMQNQIVTIQPSAPVLEAKPVILHTVKDRMEEQPRSTNRLRMSAGYGFVYSEIVTPDCTYKGKGGIDWKLEYNRMFHNGLGFGVQYSGFKASYFERGYMLLTYIAPSLVGCVTLTDECLLNYGVGIGYFRCNDSGERTSSGLGFDLNFGTEYRASEHVGLGLELQSVNGVLPKRKGVEATGKKPDGLLRLAIQGGVRIYF